MNQFKKYTATILSLSCVLSLSACSSKEEPYVPVASTPTYTAPSIPQVTPAPTVTPTPEVTPELTPEAVPETILETDPLDPDMEDLDADPSTEEMGEDLEPSDVTTSATVDPSWTAEEVYAQYAERLFKNMSQLSGYLESISNFEVMDESLYTHIEEVYAKVDRKVNILYTNLPNVPTAAQDTHLELITAIDEFFTNYEKACLTIVELALLQEAMEETQEDALASDTALREDLSNLTETFRETMEEVTSASQRLDVILETYLDIEFLDALEAQYNTF